jgi:hypothetical protein
MEVLVRELGRTECLVRQWVAKVDPGTAAGAGCRADTRKRMHSERLRYAVMRVEKQHEALLRAFQAFMDSTSDLGRLSARRSTAGIGSAGSATSTSTESADGMTTWLRGLS